MAPIKVRFVWLIASVLFAGAALLPGRSITLGQEPANPRKAGIKELQQEWLNTLRSVAKQEAMRAKTGQGTAQEALASARMLAEAELEVCESDKGRVAVLERILAVARDMEQLAESLVKSGQAPVSTALRAKADRLRFQIALERAKAAAGAKPVDGGASVREKSRRVQLALAEKQAAIKQAAVKVAEAQQAKAQAGVAIYKAQIVQARLAESSAEKQIQRFNALFKANAINERVLDEQREKAEAANISRHTAEAQVVEAECQVRIEQAKVEQAQFEFEEAQLRLEQRKAALQSRE